MKRRGPYAPIITKEFYDQPILNPLKKTVARDYYNYKTAKPAEPVTGPDSGPQCSETLTDVVGSKPEMTLTDVVESKLEKPRFFGPYLKCSCGRRAKSRRISPAFRPGFFYDDAVHIDGNSGCSTERELIPCNDSTEPLV